MRLNKLIAHSGIASRRKADALILDRKVTINAKVMTELGYVVKKNDLVMVNGRAINVEDKIYLLFYKPKACISSVNDDKGRVTVIDYLGGVHQRVYPVGRLDYDTTGTLILTNDGEFSNLIINPKSNIHKTYTVWLDGILTSAQKKQLEMGVKIDHTAKTQPCKIKVIEKNFKHNNCKVTITITEGKNRQVRKMFEFVGLKVRRLHRESIEFLNVTDLAPGQYRLLKAHEVKQLRQIALDEANKSTK